jgi:hypothetical protein
LRAQPHNLLVVSDRLYARWYVDGVRVFDLDVSDPDQPMVTPAGFYASEITYGLRILVEES